MREFNKGKIKIIKTIKLINQILILLLACFCLIFAFVSKTESQLASIFIPIIIVLSGFAFYDIVYFVIIYKSCRKIIKQNNSDIFNKNINRVMIKIESLEVLKVIMCLGVMLLTFFTAGIVSFIFALQYTEAAFSYRFSILQDSVKFLSSCYIIVSSLVIIIDIYIYRKLSMV